MLVLKRVILLLVAGYLTISSAFGAELDWWVVNRFPVFKQAEDFQALEAAWDPSFKASSTIGSPGISTKLEKILPVDQTAWNPSLGQYDKRFLFRDTHDVQAKLSGVAPGTQCIWVINDAEPKTSDCALSPKLTVKAHEAFDLHVIPSGGEPMRAHFPAIAERLIVSLGDSFASGEGNPQSGSSCGAQGFIGEPGLVCRDSCQILHPAGSPLVGRGLSSIAVVLASADCDGSSNSESTRSCSVCVLRMFGSRSV